MYKKITIIVVSFLPKDYLYTQGLILMFISGFTYFITKMKEPFANVSINTLENTSNFSAFLIILVGNLSISSLQQSLKQILAITMIFSSFYFFLKWFSSTLDIFLSQNSELVKTKCFKFYVLYQTTLKICKISKISSLIMKKNPFIDRILLIYQIEKERTIKEVNESMMKKSQIGHKAKKGKYFKKALKFLNEL